MPSCFAKEKHEFPHSMLRFSSKEIGFLSFCVSIMPFETGNLNKIIVVCAADSANR
jgi:hypothetical protein